MLASDEGLVYPDSGESSRREQAEAHVRALAGSLDTPITFQTFDDTGEDPSLAVILHAPLCDAWDRLQDLQEHGAGVFLMVNEGDGFGRAAVNVRALRALFYDADHPPFPDLNDLKPRPGILVSSGGGEHGYWLLKPGEPLAQFTDAQARIAARLGTDGKVKDLPRVLRLAGTFNLKDRSNPRPVELIWADGSQRHTIAHLLERLGAAPLAVEGLPAAPSRVILCGNAEERARAYISQIVAIEGQGGDQQTFCAAASLLRDFSIPPARAWEMLCEWNATNASPPWPEVELGRKFQNAQRHGKAPIAAKLAEAYEALPAPGLEEAASSPDLDPSLWCCDLSQRGRGWRFWRDCQWMDGISQSDLERFLENEGGLSKRAIKQWLSKPRVVKRSIPVYGSAERIVKVDGEQVANVFRRPPLEPLRGDWTPIQRILLNLVAGDSTGFEWTVGWLGRVVQGAYAGDPRRIGTAPVFFGARGAGKGVLEEVCKALVGPWNVASIAQGDMDSAHNVWLAGKLLVCADEVFVAEGKSGAQIAKIKNLITATSRLINPKGKDQVQVDARENWLLFSNSHRPVEVEPGDRRFTLFRTGGPCGVELGNMVAEDARAAGPYVRAFLGHLLNLPASALVSEYRPLHTRAKDEVASASGNSAVRFAHEVKARGLYSMASGMEVRDLYMPTPNGLRRVEGYETPVILCRTLMQVYRGYAAETNAPALQESTVLAALREAIGPFFTGDLPVAGRRERVVAGLPGMLPEFTAVAVAPPEPAQQTLAV